VLKVLLTKELALHAVPPTPPPRSPATSLSQPWQCNTTCAERESGEGRGVKGVWKVSKET
jgi:hypothetical protein